MVSPVNASTAFPKHPTQFSVDAALLQELGERLIGRPEIALAELIKNSYDADASTCTVTFQGDSIEISDDGHGMSSKEFHDYWMRVGTTHKRDDGRSRELDRPLTGSKGVGRLAVQFLASEMWIETTAKNTPRKELVAFADWTRIKRGAELSSVDVLWEERATVSDRHPAASKCGTRIILKKLKDVWDAERLQRLGEDLWTLRSPFRKRGAVSNKPSAANFDIVVVAPEIAGAQSAFDKTLDSLFNNWKARIQGRVDNGRDRARAAISIEFKPGYPADTKAEKFQTSLTLPVDVGNERKDKRSCINQVSFEILVFKIEGKQGGGVRVDDAREYLQKHGNVGIYDAGFRLPYYGMDNDWLDVVADQAARLSVSKLLPKELEVPDRYMLDLPDSRRLFGAVEINTAEERAIGERCKAPPGEYLELQAGRDRLHDNQAFGQLKRLVRFSLDYYASRYRLRESRRIEEGRDKERSSQKQLRALRILDANQEKIPRAVYATVKREVQDALKASEREEESLDRRAALLAPLASAGMAALALNHEFARERRLLKRVIATLRALSRELRVEKLASLADELAAANRRIESMQGLFAPLLSDQDKTAEQKLRVKPVVQGVIENMKTFMPRVEFDSRSIAADTRFPIGSLAEWNALLQNVFTNAWDAMLSAETQKVRISAGSGPRRREWLRVSDTGVGLAVPIEESAKLFNPFERISRVKSDQESLALGGQGLGLAIVRMIANKRNAEVCFVSPENGYSTTIELSWRG